MAVVLPVTSSGSLRNEKARAVPVGCPFRHDYLPKHLQSRKLRTWRVGARVQPTSSDLPPNATCCPLALSFVKRIDLWEAVMHANLELLSRGPNKVNDSVIETPVHSDASPSSHQPTL